VAVEVRNVGDRNGAEIVQLYLHDPVASVVRPVQRLIGFARVELDAAEAARIEFQVPADLASFTLAPGRRIVEPGEIVLGFGRSSSRIEIEHRVRLVGETRVVDHTREFHPVVTITRL
jgi:beta-xylosidase